MPNKRNSNYWMRYAGMGAQILVMLGLAVWLGLWLDKKTNWPIPVFTIVLPLVAIIYFLYTIIRDVSRKD